MSQAPDDRPRDGESDLFGPLSHLARSGGAASTRTVWTALGANVLVAVAKSIAAVVTGSASMLAEAAHSWADTGKEVLLLVANRRSHRPLDRAPASCAVPCRWITVGCAENVVNAGVSG